MPTVLSIAAVEHLRKVANDDQLLSIPLKDYEQCGLQSLRQYVSRPSTTPKAEDHGNMMLDSDPAATTEQPPLENTPLEAKMFLRIVKRRLAKHRLQSVAPAVGRRAKVHQIAVAIASAETYQDETMRSQLPLGAVVPDSVALLSLVGTDPQWLRENVLIHDERPCLMYSMPATGIQDCDEALSLHKAIEHLMSAGAVHISETRCAMPDECVAATRAMLEAGCLPQRPADDGGVEYQITSHGIASLRASTELDEGKKVFEPRSDLAIEDRTPLEMMVSLIDQGWTWRRLPDKKGGQIGIASVLRGRRRLAPNILYDGDLSTSVFAMLVFDRCFVRERRACDPSRPKGESLHRLTGWKSIRSSPSASRSES